MNRVEYSLDGVWSFAFSETAPKLRDIRFNDVMTVPGCFDVMEPYYGKRGYGIFRRKVRTSGRVKLFIDGVGIEGKLYWDGNFIGALPYAYMPEEFVFDAGALDEHELVIQICNHYNHVVFPFYDFYAYGGIFGSITLTELPAQAIREVRIQTIDYSTGRIRMYVRCDHGTEQTLRIGFDSGRKEVVQKLRDGELDSTFSVPNFELWSPDSPRLHRAILTLGEDRVEQSFGIRQTSCHGRELRLNGKRLVLMGYNRHESHPYFGAATPPSLMLADLQTIKAQGCNFIRGSHYPQRRSFLELCDRLGMLVWEETIGWDIKPPELLSPQFEAQQLDQAHKLTRMSINHPSVIIRGFLNETESQLAEVRPLIQKIRDAIRSEDDQCLITYASNKYEKDLCMDLVDIVAMNPYPGWGDVNWDTVRDIDKVRPRFDALLAAVPQDRPYMISETGGSGIYGFRDPYQARWSEEYQAELLSKAASIILNSRDYSGLAIWHFCDAKSYINGFVMGRPRGFNDKGVRDEYRRPKLAWDAITKCIAASDFKKNQPIKKG